MLAIYIVTLLVLIGSDIFSSRVHAGSSKSSDSSDSSDSSKSGSKGNDDNHCRKAVPKQEAIENKIKSLNSKKQPLPTCTCGSSGTICKIDIFDAKSGKTTTLSTCAGCIGLQVAITSLTECKNVPDIFPDLREFCQIVHPRCKSVTMYRCGCPTKPVTYAPLQTTTSVPPPAVTTQDNPTVSTVSPTPILVPGAGGYDY